MPLSDDYGGQISNFTDNFLISQINTIQTIIEDDIFEVYPWKGNDDINSILITLLDELFFIINRNNEINIFTTNYDNTIETYWHQRRDYYVLINGFSHDQEIKKYVWNNDFISDSKKIRIFLHKLHDSLDWKENDDGIINTGMKVKSDIKTQRNMLIYPALSPKEDEQQEPYKSLIYRFKKFVQNSDVCGVIGYLFRDSLNDIFLDFLKKGNKELIVISPLANNEVRSNLLKENKVGHSKPNVDIISYINMDTGSHSTINCINLGLEEKDTFRTLERVPSTI